MSGLDALLAHPDVARLARALYARCVEQRGEPATGAAAASTRAGGTRRETERGAGERDARERDSGESDAGDRDAGDRGAGDRGAGAPPLRAAVAVVLRACPASTGGTTDMHSTRPDATPPLELLLIRRATWEGDPWSGHIALPGGRREPRDRSLEETATRETREETAVDLSRSGRLLGRLDDLAPLTVRHPALIVSPFVYAAAGDLSPVPSAEVADVFWAPLAALRDPAAGREVVVAVSGVPRTVRAYRYRGHVIWGLTERILARLFALLE